MKKAAVISIETNRRLQQFKLDNNFRSLDLVINFLFNFFVEEQEKALIIEENSQKTSKKKAKESQNQKV